MFLLQAVLVLSFLTSQLTNGLLLFLLQTNSGKCLGTYRHLMAVFALFAICFNWVDITSQPIVHIEEQMWLVVNHGPMRYHRQIGYFLICFFCGSFGMCISLLASLFIYRYVAICKSHLLVHLEGRKLAFLFIFPVTISTLWFTNCFLLLGMTSDKVEFLRESILETYGEDMRKITFMGGMYWNSQGVWNVSDLAGTVILTTLMVICLSTIVFCALKTYKKMNDTSIEMSNRTRALNRQLFVTLCLQTLMPYLMLYMPVGLFFYLPLFQVNIGWLANIAGITAATYPALEPLIAIFCITSFRKTVTCSKRSQKVSSTGASSTL